MHEIEPFWGLTGGLLIGASASLLLLLNGRVAGISGIAAGAFAGTWTERRWRVAFLAGLILGPLAVEGVSGVPARIDPQASLPLTVVAGLLVGFGTRLGNGCTSGHGVCGLARGSGRSLTATVVFFTIAALTVLLARHGLGG